MQYGHVIAKVFGQPWAILPETLETIASLVSLRATGVRLTADEIQERLAAAALAAGPRSGAGRVAGIVGLIPVYGTIMQHASLMSEMSGGTSIEGITSAFRRAMADPEITSILFDVDSGGGEVGGVSELAAEIRSASKPTAAIADMTIASAAYWLISGCDEIISTRTGWLGSIGVRTMHMDRSGEMAQAGISPTMISAGRYKTEGNPYGPLTTEGLAAAQQICDDYYALMTGDIAAGRGTTAAAVVAGYGEGRMLTAKRAVAAGLADRIDTMDGAARRLASGMVTKRMMAGSASRGMSAEAEVPEPEATALPDPSAALALARARANAS